MSSELLMNLETPVQTKTTTKSENTSLKTEKKEGFSLFDSLVNEAKNDTEQKTTKTDNKNTQEKSSTPINEPKNENLSLGKNQNINKQEVVLKTSPENAEVEIKDVSNLKVKSETPESLKTMVDKLVDIIVSSAKEIFNTKNVIDSTQTQAVKNKINQLLENKISSNTNLKELKSEVNKILGETKITKVQKEFVTNEISKVITKEISEGFSLEDLKKTLVSKIDTIKKSTKIIEEKTQEVTKLVSQNSPSDTKKLKLETEKISQEAVSITNQTKVIKEVMSNTPQIKEAKKAVLVTKEIKEVISNTPQIKEAKEAVLATNHTKEKKQNSLENIETKISEIIVSSDDIKIEIKKIKPHDTKVTQKQENAESFQKIELKLETINENVKSIEETVSKTIVVKTLYTEEDQLLDESKFDNVTSTKSVLVDDKSEKNPKNPLLATMFLNAQKTLKEKTSLLEVKDAKENIIDKKTVEAVKVSANKLDLVLEQTEVSHEGDEVKKVNQKIKNEDTNINSFASNKNFNKLLINQKAEMNIQKTDIMQTQISSKEISDNIEKEKQKENVVEIHVAKDVAQSLQHKIIGAQQKMGSFMSEVARNMYLNYKPPVTAFRVNLNPANLGSISIIMRANKVDNSLSVSMNLSNSNTMESFTENKVMLQNAIQRQFNDGSNVSINFGMQDQSSENNFSDNFNQNDSKNSGNSNDTNNANEEITEEQEIIDNNDYM